MPNTWVQPMLNPRDCIHGRLARKCDICERDEEIRSLRNDLHEVVAAIDAAYAILNGSQSVGGPAERAAFQMAMAKLWPFVTQQITREQDDRP